MRSGRTLLVSVIGAVLLTLWMAAPIFGQSTSVLGVVPEGAVLDAGPFPDLRPGARIGFRRSDGSAAQVGEGWVLDVREGRALVGLKPGGSVQEGDVAVACASLTGPGSQTDLRASVQGLKTQLSSSGGGSAELQTAITQLESTLDAREIAIRDGSCDVASHDQQIVALSQQLQQMVAASPATAPPPSPSATPGQETVVAAPPSEGVPPAAGQGTTASEGLAAALPFLQQIFQMAQSMGLVGGGTPSEGQQPVAAVPPPDGGLPPTPVPSTGDPPSPSGPPPVIIDGTRGPAEPPKVFVKKPPAPPPPKVIVGPPSPPPASPPPGSERPPGVVLPPGPSQWWTTITPKQAPPVITGAVPGSPFGSIGSGTGTEPDTTKQSPTPGTTPHGLKLLPGTTGRLGSGPIVGLPPTLQRTAAVQGVVRADNGAAVPGANVVIGGKQAATNARGVFQVDDVPLGRQILVVTARGFVQGKLTVDLSSGEVERVTLTLRRATPLPLRQLR